MKECYKIKIEPLTAVHIGTGERLLPIDYVLKAPENSERTNYVKFSSERIIDSILKSGSPKQKQELQRVSDENNINSLASFFQKYFYLGIDYDSRITNGFLNLHSQKIKSGLFENSLAVNQMLHHGAKPYIPGSSIKGAVRTAILNKALSDLQIDEYNDLQEMADNEKNKDFKKFGNYENRIQAKALSMLKVQGIDSAKLDPFRCIEITDCEFSVKNQIVGQMENLKIDRAKKELYSESMQMIAEAITGKLADGKAVSDFIIRINKDLQNIALNNGFCINKKIDINEIISACNFFFKTQFSKEYKKFYQDAYEGLDTIVELKKIIDAIPDDSENEFLLRIGHWSQVEFVTLEENFRNPKTPVRKGKVMPYGTSRTGLNYNGQYLPMGWCRCTVEKE